MWPEDLKVIYDSLRDLVTDQGFAPGTRPFIFQEVIDLGGEDVHREEYLGIGRVTEMRVTNCFPTNFSNTVPLKTKTNIEIEQ